MNQINMAIRQHLFEVLSEKYPCKIGSDHIDCSYIDYSDALEVKINGEVILILCGSKQYPDGVRVMWSGGPMAYKDLLREAIIPDIAEPDFASFTDRIVKALDGFKMVAVNDDS